MAMCRCFPWSRWRNHVGCRMRMVSSAQMWTGVLALVVSLLGAKPFVSCASKQADSKASQTFGRFRNHIWWCLMFLPEVMDPLPLLPCWIFKFNYINWLDSKHFGRLVKLKFCLGETHQPDLTNVGAGTHPAGSQLLSAGGCLVSQAAQHQLGLLSTAADNMDWTSSWWWLWSTNRSRCYHYRSLLDEHNVINVG